MGTVHPNSSILFISQATAVKRIEISEILKSEMFIVEYNSVIQGKIMTALILSMGRIN